MCWSSHVIFFFTSFLWYNAKQSLKKYLPSSAFPLLCNKEFSFTLPICTQNLLRSSASVQLNSNKVPLCNAYEVKTTNYFDLNQFILKEESSAIKTHSHLYKTLQGFFNFNFQVLCTSMDSEIASSNIQIML